MICYAGICEGNTVRFRFNNGVKYVIKEGKVCKIIDHGPRHGIRVNVFDGRVINHVSSKDIIEVIGGE